MGILLLFFSSYLVVTFHRSRETHGKALIAFRALSLDPLNTSDRADLISSDCGFSLYAHFDSRSLTLFFGPPSNWFTATRCCRTAMFVKIKRQINNWFASIKGALRWELRVDADGANVASCQFLLETRHPPGPWELSGRGQDDDHTQLSWLLLETSIFLLLLFFIQFQWFGLAVDQATHLFSLNSV